jgi:outer membrane protein assembly factor BamE (lipoprotein component of BamABCDE complex)
MKSGNARSVCASRSPVSELAELSLKSPEGGGRKRVDAEAGTIRAAHVTKYEVERKGGSMNNQLVFCVITVVVSSMSGCIPLPTKPVTTRNSELTHGNVQLKVRIGETTQAQVLEVFGAPNITTIDSSRQEVWTYQRAATVEQSERTRGFWTILLTGGAAAIAGQSQETSGLEQTQRMMTLIIRFSDQNVVTDFRSRASEF